MMQGYRAASPPSVEVALGPLPLQILHFLRPALVFFVALAIAGFTLSAALRGPTPAVLRCAREGDTMSCEDWRGDPMQLVHRFSGPTRSVHFYRSGGRSSKECVAIENQIACGGQAKANVARINALAPGEHVDLDATDRDPTLYFVGGAFAFLFFALAGVYLLSTLARRSVFRIRLGPTALEVVDEKGATLHTLLRGRGEAVRIVQMRAARGEFPKYEIAYGIVEPFTAITSFQAGELDLEPIAARLREALARLPPP
jgi:hypothetical protein